MILIRKGVMEKYDEQKEMQVLEKGGGKEKDRRRKTVKRKMEKSKQMKKLEMKEKNDKSNHRVEINKGKRRTRKKTFFFLSLDINLFYES